MRARRLTPLPPRRERVWKTGFGAIGHRHQLEKPLSGVESLVTRQTEDHIDLLLL